MSWKASPAASRELTSTFGFFLFCLLAVLGACFWASFLPGQVQFSNDAPLGVYLTQWLKLPESFWGTWVDLNGMGFSGGVAIMMPTNLLRLVLGAVWFAKWYPPITLLFLGCSAWLLFRSLKFSPIACVLGGLATVLNSDFFSVACWGVGSQNIAFGFNFLAVALLVSDNRGWRGWVKPVLAGLAVGMSIMEGVDNGAIFSLFVAAFALVQSLVGTGHQVTRIARGVGRVALVAMFAALMAAQTLTVLVGTQIQGIAILKETPEAKAKHWDWATQWSLPKREALTLVVPGLFGYRMDTPDGGNYWGAVGRDPALDRYFESGAKDSPPGGFMRFTGGGIYAGVIVALIAVWAAVQSFRRKGSAFSPTDRKFIWFWCGVVVVALLFAFGRFAPFYQFVYALPYFSNIRNPAKFVHVLSWAMVILFAYGVDGLWRGYLAVPSGAYPGMSRQLKNWWAKVSSFDRRWTIGALAALAVSFLGWLMYSSMRGDLIAYLQTVQFDEGAARAIASFSVGAVGWFVLLLALAAGMVTLMLSGVFAGPRAKWGGLLLGLLVVLDLCRADRPWILYWNYQEKYATNPVIELLRDQPYNSRVAMLPLRSPPQLALFDQLYRIEWAQHLFPYYNIQSLDLIQMSRMPEDMAAFEDAMQFRGTPETMHLLGRRWELTNTRYLLGPAAFLDGLNQQLSPDHPQFRIRTNFNVVAKPGISNPMKLEQLTATTVTNGPYALFEFTGALPRVKLYSQWQAPATDPTAVESLRAVALSTNDLTLLTQVGTNDFLTLRRLASREFDPHKTVLLADTPPVPQSTGEIRPDAGTVEYTSYFPTRIVLKAKADTASVLLLNDKYDANWRVSVDGKPAPLLRCNFLMRGVYLTPGEHVVEFAFKPTFRSIYVTVGALLLGLILIGCLAVARRVDASKRDDANPSPAGTKR